MTGHTVTALHTEADTGWQTTFGGRVTAGRIIVHRIRCECGWTDKSGTLEGARQGYIRHTRGRTA